MGVLQKRGGKAVPEKGDSSAKKEKKKRKKGELRI